MAEAMSTGTVHLASSLALAEHRRMEAASAVGVKALCLEGALSSLTRCVERLQRDCENPGYLFATKVALERVRERNVEYRTALTESNAGITDVVVAVSRMVGVCAACGDEASSGFLGPFCDDCLDESVPF